MSDRVRLQPGRDVRDPQLSLAGTRASGIPQAPVPSRAVQNASAADPALGLAGAAMSFVGERMVQQEVARATEGARAEPLQRDANHNLIIPDNERSFFDTPTEEAARAVRMGRYAVEVGLEQQRALVALRRDNPDAESFQAAVERWRDGVLANVPAAARGPIAAELDNLAGQHRQNIADETLRQQKEEGAQRAILALRQLMGEGHDLIVAGREGEALAPDGPMGKALATLRTQMAVGIIPAQVGVAMERAIVATGPARAQLMREVAGMAPDAGARVLERLKAGPVQGQPWNPAWDALTPEERGQLADFAGAYVGARRANEEHGRIAGQRALTQEVGRLMLEQRQLTLAVDGRGPGVLPMPQERVRMAQIEARLGEIVALTGQTAGLAGIGALQGFEQRQMGEAGRQTLAFLDMKQSREMMLANPAMAERERELFLMTQHMPMAEAAVIWRAEAAGAQAQLAAAQKQAEGDQAFWMAMTTDGPVGRPVANNNENQGRALTAIRTLTGTGMSEPQAVATVARSGVIPEGAVKKAEQAVMTGEGLAQAAALHELMKRDPRAYETWAKQSTPQLRAALEDVAIAMALAPRPTGNEKADAEAAARWAPTERRIHDSAREALTQVRYTSVTEAMASLGATKPERDAALNDAVVRAWDKAQLGFFARNNPWADSATMTTEMRHVMERMTLMNMRAYGSVEKAAEEAARMLGANYTLTKLGMSNAIGAGGPLTMGAGVVGDPNLPGRMVPKGQAPETYVAPWGQGGGYGTDWMKERLPAMLEEAGAKIEGRPLALGMNTFLRAAPGQPDGMFEVWALNRDEALVPIRRVVAGQDAVAVAVIDLKEWAKRTETERVQRDRQRFAAEERRRLEGRRGVLPRGHLRDQGDAP